MEVGVLSVHQTNNKLQQLISPRRKLRLRREKKRFPSTLTGGYSATIGGEIRQELSEIEEFWSSGWETRSEWFKRPQEKYNNSRTTRKIQASISGIDQASRVGQDSTFERVNPPDIREDIIKTRKQDKNFDLGCNKKDSAQENDHNFWSTGRN